MPFELIQADKRSKFNSFVNHPLQSYEWGEFREQTGVKVIRRGLFEKAALVSAYQLTIHPIPKTSYSVGYLPKGTMPDMNMIKDLREVGAQEKCIFIQLEPDVVKQIYHNTKGQLDTTNPEVLNSVDREMLKLGMRESARPLFTKYTFVLDLQKTTEEILANMHSKTRYNIRIAEKHSVSTKIQNDASAFKEYLKLTRETTTRQKFYAHSENYHKKQWEILGSKYEDENQKNRLGSHLLSGSIKNETLVSWILFTFKDKLYYPYGASSSLHREAMASNLVMYEAIKFGQEQNLKQFDMWGALGPIPDTTDNWHGFHRFKLGYGADLYEMIGSYDLVINPIMYEIYKVVDKLRWVYLRMKK